MWHTLFIDCNRCLFFSSIYSHSRLATGRKYWSDLLTITRSIWNRDCLASPCQTSPRLVRARQILFFKSVRQVAVRVHSSSTTFGKRGESPSLSLPPTFLATCPLRFIFCLAILLHVFCQFIHVFPRWRSQRCFLYRRKRR